VSNVEYLYKFEQRVIQDLNKSDLTPNDLSLRPISGSEVSACNISSGLGGLTPSGYVIPYFNLEGDPLAYYRVKLLDGNVKYKSQKGVENHIYFPIGFRILLDSMAKLPESQRYIIVTEGEKKAACAVKKGIPCAALPGVNSWKSRYITLPGDTTFDKVIRGKTEVIKAHIPRGDSNISVVEGSGVVATGLLQLIDYVVKYKFNVIIIFDTDKGGVKPEVQKAAAAFGYELKYKGVTTYKIRNLILPWTSSGIKVGLDDFLVGAFGPSSGVESFRRLISTNLAKPNAFPKHPNPKAFISGKLAGQNTRKENQEIALTVLMELEARGKRLIDEGINQVYYFDEESYTLMPVHLQNQRIGLHETYFGGHLYKNFDISAADSKVIQWLATQYFGEAGITPVKTAKLFAFPQGKEFANCIAYQLTSSKFVIITPWHDKPFVICNNGDHGVLFTQGTVDDDLDVNLLEQRLNNDMALPLVETPLWFNVLSKFNIDMDTPVVDVDGNIKTMPINKVQAYWTITLLYYLSPWLLRWRGTQLPIEMIIGEAGSGKSSLYELRQMILSGKTRLSNMTNDIKDWYAGITSAPGLHVLDNVHFTAGAKDYKQRLSDEYCRLTTELSPHIEMRKLYTTNDMQYVPVHAVFGVTALEQPFYNTDFLQRSSIFQVKSLSKDHDAKWLQRQIENGGGRVGWLAHHLVVIHKFLNLAIEQGQWNNEYKAKHRLANFEQCLLLMAQVFGIDSSFIISTVNTQIEKAITESDWVLQGLKDFCQELKEKYPKDYMMKTFGVKELSLWAQASDQHSRNITLINPWKLGKYIKTHTFSLEKSLHLKLYQHVNNKAMYQVAN